MVTVTKQDGVDVPVGWRIETDSDSKGTRWLIFFSPIAMITVDLKERVWRWGGYQRRGKPAAEHGKDLASWRRVFSGRDWKKRLLQSAVDALKKDEERARK